ncbi:hypothetical protein cypCar_00022743, partial [Cyprinus carpio]
KNSISHPPLRGGGVPHFRFVLCSLAHVLFQSLAAHRALNLVPGRKSSRYALYPVCGHFIMFLQYYLNENGDRVYTLKKLDPSGQPTSSAHPARFSPDDKFSRHRVTIKRRFGLLLTQQPRPVL